jgi:hypothetical protein
MDSMDEQSARRSWWEWNELRAERRRQLADDLSRQDARLRTFRRQAASYVQDDLQVAQDRSRAMTRVRLAHIFRVPGTPLSEDAALLRKRTLHQAETDPGHLDMSIWDSSAADELQQALQHEAGCGTTRCVAGWALYFFGDPVKQGEDSSETEARAVKALELTAAEYLGSPRERPLFLSPADNAIARLRQITETPAA